MLTYLAVAVLGGLAYSCLPEAVHEKVEDVKTKVKDKVLETFGF